MKKILTLALALVLICTAVSCNKTNNEVNENQQSNVNQTVALYENIDLVAVTESLYENVNSEIGLMTTLLDSETFEYFTFIPYEEGLNAVASEPMMSSIAHSLVLVKASDAENAERIAKAMKENCNPVKWVCVEADVVETRTNGNLAMLLMTKKQAGMADGIIKAFSELTPEKASTIVGVTPEEDVVDDENVGEEISDDEVVVEPETEVVPETTPEVLPETDVAPEEVVPENVSVVNPENNVETEPEADTETEVVPEEDNGEQTLPVEPEIPDVEDEVVEPEADENASVADKLYAIADKLYEGIDVETMPMMGVIELNAENFEYSAFIPYKDTYKAIESMPMMGSNAHSVVVVETQNEEEAAAVAKEMEANCDPRKWICVQAKAVKSASKGNFAILVMTSVEVMPQGDMTDEQAEEESFKLSEQRAEIIVNNFLANA